YAELSKQEKTELLKRPKIDFSSIFEAVQPIIDEVEQEGDAALKRLTEKFDKVKLDAVCINPKEVEISLSEEKKDAIDTALKNIFNFHKAQIVPPVEVETMPGVRCMKVSR